MKTDNQKTIETLNDLLKINNDRIEGYNDAVRETEEKDLKDLFSRFSATSLKCKQELIAEIQKLGGTPVEGTTMSGKFYRAWMDVRAALTGKSRKAILRSCEMGEDVAVRNYEEALKNPSLEFSVHQVVNDQYSRIRSEHDQVKALRDATVSVNA